MIDLMTAIQSLRPNAQLVIRGDVIEWLDTTQTQPTDAEITTEIARLEVQQVQDKINAEARAYLASTDWLVTRQTETGVVVPADILTKRQAAREEVI